MERVPQTERAPARIDSAYFSRFAQAVSGLAGHPVALAGAVAVILLWAVLGPFFGFSDTWQLVMATSTSVMAFLMVFIIQHTQNRETRAIQVKLAELILVMKGAQDRLANVEDLPDDELKQLQEDYRRRAQRATAREVQAQKRR